MPRWLDTTLWLAVLGSLVCNLSTYNFDMPLAIINGDVGNPAPMANSAEQGDLIRQVYIVAFAVLGPVVARRTRTGLPASIGWLAAISIATLSWNCLSYTWADSPDIVGRRIVALVLCTMGASGLACLTQPQDSPHS